MDDLPALRLVPLDSAVFTSRAAAECTVKYEKDAHGPLRSRVECAGWSGLSGAARGWAERGDLSTLLHRFIFPAPDKLVMCFMV